MHFFSGVRESRTHTAHMHHSLSGTGMIYDVDEQKILWTQFIVSVLVT